MGQLTPIELEDGTVIYIEAAEKTTPGLTNPQRGLFPDDPQKQITQSFQAIEGTIRAYTTHTLNAFRNLAIAEVSEVNLKFGVNINATSGVPYIAAGSAGCNVEISVKCVFPQKSEE
jgi:hypothetical protein